MFCSRYELSIITTALKFMNYDYTEFVYFVEASSKQIF